MFIRSVWLVLFVASFSFGEHRLGAGEKAKQTPPEIEKLPAGAVARLGSLAFSHGNAIGAVGAVALEANGKMAATAGRSWYTVETDGQEAVNVRHDDLNIRLWEVPAGRQVRVIQAPKGPVAALDFSPDGKFLVACCGRMVCRWEVATGKELQRINVNGDASLVKFSADGKTVFVFDGTLLHWDPQQETTKSLWKSKEDPKKLFIHSADLTPDGSQLAILVGNIPELPALPAPGIPRLQEIPARLEVFDTSTGKQLFRSEENLGMALAQSPDKERLAFGDRRITVWDLSKNKKLRELESVLAPPLPPRWEKLLQLPAAEERSYRYTALLFSPDGKMLASTVTTGDVHLWHVESGKKIAVVLHSTNTSPRFAGETLAFSRDGKILALGGSEVLRLVDTTSGKEIAPWPGHRLPVIDFRYSPDGTTLFTRDGVELCCWNIKNWQLVSRHSFVPFQNKVLMAISQEKKWVITGAKDEMVLEDLTAPGKVLARFPDKDNKFDGAMFSFDGSIVCLETFSREGTLHATFFSAPDGKELCQLELEKVSSFNFSPVSNAISWVDQEGAYFQADARTGKIIRKVQVGAEQETATRAGIRLYSWDGRYIVFQPTDAEGNVLPVWDVEAKRVAYRINLPAKSLIASMDITYDSRLMVYTQAGKNDVHVLELASGRERRPLKGTSTRGLARLATSPVDFTVATGIPGNTVLVWDLALPPKKLAKLQLEREEIAALWLALADVDAVKAEDAIESLIQVPAQAVPFLREHLKPIANADAKQLQRLIADLGSSNFPVREKSFADLGKIVPLAEEALRQALKKEKIPEETRQRIEKLLAKPLFPTDSATLQGLRALEILEKIGTHDAGEVLEALARGASRAHLTQEAELARKRLERKKS